MYTAGLEYFLTWLHENYSRGSPIYVSENGMALDDPSPSEGGPDATRIQFIEDHIEATRRAIAKGAPLQGHMVWSLQDNFKWDHGNGSRFEIVNIDFKIMERRPEASTTLCGQY